MADDVDRLAVEIVEDIVEAVRTNLYQFEIVARVKERISMTERVAALIRARLPSGSDHVSLPASELAALREAKAALDALEALAASRAEPAWLCIIPPRRGDSLTWTLMDSDSHAYLADEPTLASAALAAKGAG